MYSRARAFSVAVTSSLSTSLSFPRLSLWLHCVAVGVAFGIGRAFVKRASARQWPQIATATPGTYTGNSISCLVTVLSPTIATMQTRRVLLASQPLLQRIHLMAWQLSVLLLTTIPSQYLCAKDGVEIRVFPASIDLTHQGSEQSILVQGVDAEGVLLGPVTDAVDYEIDDPKIAVVVVDEKHRAKVRGVASGTTQMKVRRVKADGSIAVASVPIKSVKMESSMDWEFTNHVQSVLARSGCNMGACHGALAGKGGFRLSLRGYDPATDHFNITRQDRGRRIELNDPAMSLLLAKPSGAVEHKGGVRLPVDSPDYALLADWIARGAEGARDSDPKLQRISIYPDVVRLEKNDVQPLLVLAQYDNGRVEDVTRWAKFNSTDESVAIVDEFGLARVVGPGEGAVTAWFASRIVSARLTVPFSSATPNPPSDFVAANPIDVHVLNQLNSLGLDLSNRCTDSEFIRRTSLDATGTLPSQEQVVSFLNDNSPDKREKWIDSLLESPEFVDYWTYRWSDLLMLNSNLLRSEGLKSYYQWIRNNVQKNTPWDEFVTQIITARGEALENGATNFYAINQDPESMTENACQAFLGLSIGCAKCHNHPLEKWTNDQYYAMANLFARVRAKGWGGEVRDGDSSRTVMVLDRGDLIQPLRGKPQPPAPLDAPPVDSNSTEDRREYLAKWMVSPKNPYFTRAIVNRVWAAYFGVGIVNAVDDLRASNPESNPALMSFLSEHLVEKKYDLKQLMRLIMNSETYQRSSVVTEGNRADRKYFSHYYPKRLMAEVIHDSIASVCQVPTEFNKVAFLGGDKRDTKFYAKGTRAIQLFDSSVDNSFLKTFGRNQRRITCECERSDEPSIIQVLNLNNGDTLNNKLSQSGGVVDQLMKEFGESNQGLVMSAYLKCLSRLPTDRELNELTNELDRAGSEKRVVVEDLLWSLMTSREFLFNH